MSLSREAIEYLAFLETWGRPVSFRTFKDERGRLACGYGHVLSAGEQHQMPMSKATAFKLLESDCQVLCEWLTEHVGAGHPQSKHEALVYWLYQAYQGRAMTPGQGVEDSLLLKYFGERKYHLAAAELDNWVYLPKPGGFRFSKALARRRSVEQQLMTTGERVQLIAQTP